MITELWMSNCVIIFYLFHGSGKYKFRLSHYRRRQASKTAKIELYVVLTSQLLISTTLGG